MNDQHLNSCREAFVNAVERGVTVCKKHQDKIPALKQMAEKISSETEERLKDFNPKIMVYGIYNAGKSTMLNALMGENKAAMNDIPTTKAINAYNWKEYTIYDTPGIDAPEKDEAVSKEQLRKCDVIIFVMASNGSFNQGKNYQELFDIVDSGKRLLLVLNAKDEKPLDDPEYQKIIANMYTDFAEVYNSHQQSGYTTPEALAKKFKIILVNASDALYARTATGISDEQRAIIIQSSHIQQLENAIIEEYGKADGFTILHQLEKSLLNNLSSIEEKIKDATSEATSSALDTRQEIQHIQDNLYAKVEDYAKDTGDELGADIYSILSKAKGEEDAQDQIETLAKDWSENVSNYMVQELGKVAKIIDTKTASLFTSINVKVGKVNLPENIKEQITQEIMPATAQTGGSNGLSTGAKVATSLAMAGSKTAAVNLAKTAVTAATKLPFIGYVVGKVLGPLVPVVGPLILVASAVLPFLGGNKEEEQQKNELARIEAQEAAVRRQQEELARRKEELKEETARIGRKLVRGILEELRKELNKIFQQTYDEIGRLVNLHNQEANEYLLTLQEIAEIKHDLSDSIANYCEA